MRSMQLNEWTCVPAVTLVVIASIGCARRPAESTTGGQLNACAVMSFGQRQLDQMLDDRPDMKEVVPPSHPVRQWLVDGFDGKRVGKRVYWSADSPTGGRTAEHVQADENRPALIHLSGGRELTPIDKWASVVYEMLNLEGDWETLRSEALDGKLDADGYAERCMALEFDALQKTQQFFLANPLPRNEHGRDHWYNWVTTGLVTFEKYRSGSNDANNNREYYKDFYRRTFLPRSDGNQAPLIYGEWYIVPAD